MGVRVSLPRAASAFRPLLPVGLLVVAACAPALNPVRGTVKYNNQPLKGAVVTFHPVGGNEVTAVRPSGVTGEDGTFTLASEKGDGAAAGEYTVTVIWLKEPDPGKPKKVSTEPPPDGVDQLKGRYADHKKTKLKAQVKSGANTLEPFVLD